MGARFVPLATVRFARAVVLDTCVLIDGYRAEEHGGDERLLRSVNTRQRRMSVVSAYEFLHDRDGHAVRSKADREKWLTRNGLREVPLNEDASDGFRRLVSEPECAGLADTLIAATCIGFDYPLLTKNVRHFMHVDGLQLVEVPR